MRCVAVRAGVGALWRGAGLLLTALALNGGPGSEALAQGQSPTVSVAITAPASGAVVTAPGTIALEATASINRQNWVVLRVDYYSGAQLIGTATAAPYRTTWANVPAGSYSVTAKAIATNAGQAKQDPATHPNMPTWEGVSAPVIVIVNAAPTVILTAPAPNTVVNAPATITVSAAAADSDGSIAKIEFYAGAALIGTATSAPYSINWPNVAAGSYSLTAVATDDRGASTTSAAVAINVNAAPTVSLTAPAAGSSYRAPAAITLAAIAADADGTVAKVEFYTGSTLITTLTAAPYSVLWTGVPVGSYTLTAKATDNQGAVTTSAPVTVTVNAAVASALYYIHTDHLNTPRVITNQAQQVVWRWYNTDPFGGNVPEENPSGLGNFTCNLRLPGQYFDRETGMHYNYFRDYDPAVGRYVQSDPIGMRGGLNTYLYADADPVSKSDPLGLDAYMCTKPLHALGGTGRRSGPDIFGNPFYHQYLCVKIGNTTVCGGQDREGGPWSPSTPSKDTFNPDTCEKKDDRACMDNCLMQAIGDPYRPPYGLFGPGTNCQEWADDAYSRCKKQCKGKL